MPAGRILVMSFRALGILVLGCLMLFNPWVFLLGLRVVGHATTVIQQLWLAFRGGFVMNRQGLGGLNRIERGINSLESFTASSTRSGRAHPTINGR